MSVIMVREASKALQAAERVPKFDLSKSHAEIYQSAKNVECSNCVAKAADKTGPDLIALIARYVTHEDEQEALFPEIIEVMLESVTNTRALKCTAFTKDAAKNSPPLFKGKFTPLCLDEYHFHVQAERKPIELGTVHFCFCKFE